MLLFLGGCGADAKNYAADNGQVAETPISSEPPPDEPAFALDTAPCLSFVEGIPIGLSCLHCGHPNAREQARKLAEIMAQSCRRNLATIMLVDGTFSDDRHNLEEFIRITTARGSTLHLFLYFANGPWQRDPINPNKGIGPQYTPEEFRERITSDPALQGLFQDRLRWALPMISNAVSLDAKIYIIPMLEDNLNAAGARAMEELTLAAVPAAVPFSLGRDPCPNCYPGNDNSVTPGLFLQQHMRSAFQGIQVSSSIVTNDGVTFTFPAEPPTQAESIPYEELLLLLQQAAATNNAFVIWRADYQGWEPWNVRPEPDFRRYHMPSDAEALALVALLQGTY